MIHLHDVRLRYPKDPSLILTIGIAVGLKIILSAATPYSHDFILQSIMPLEVGLSWIKENPGLGWWWNLLAIAIHRFWLLLPLPHPGLSNAVVFWYFDPSPSLYILILLLKLPIVVLDILIGLSIWSLVKLLGKDEGAAFWSMTMWLYNPYVTLTAEMWGSYDLVPAFLVLISVVLILRRRFGLSGLALALAIVAKGYALVLLPLFLAHLWVSREKRGLAYFSSSIAGIILAGTIIFVSIAGLEATQYMFQSFFPNFASFFLGFELNFFSREGLPTTIPLANLGIGLTAVLLVLYYALLMEFDWIRRRGLLESMLGVFLVIFSFSYWHPQHLLWVIPIMTALAGLKRQQTRFLTLFLLLAFLWEFLVFGFYFSSYGNGFFFIPATTNLLSSLSRTMNSWSEAVWYGKGVTAFLATLLRSIFAGASLIYLVKIHSPLLMRKTAD